VFEDGGHDGQDIKSATYWDEEKEEVSMTMIDADTARKTYLGVALAVQHSLRKVGQDLVWGVTRDSGCSGTPNFRSQK
jgi:hypothetical protein